MIVSRRILSNLASLLPSNPLSSLMKSSRSWISSSSQQGWCLASRRCLHRLLLPGWVHLHPPTGGWCRSALIRGPRPLPSSASPPLSSFTPCRPRLLGYFLVLLLLWGRRRQRPPQPGARYSSEPCRATAVPGVMPRTTAGTHHRCARLAVPQPSNALPYDLVHAVHPQSSTFL